jgi:hypothetical protein
MRRPGIDLVLERLTVFFIVSSSFGTPDVIRASVISGVSTPRPVSSADAKYRTCSPYASLVVEIGLAVSNAQPEKQKRASKVRSRGGQSLARPVK